MEYIVLIAYVTFQSSVLHSQPKSTVGTPAYIAPEVLLRQEYDGKVQTLHELLDSNILVILGHGAENLIM